MDEKKFIENFANQLDDTDASVLRLDTKFRDIEEWSSIVALSVMAMCAEEYDVFMSANEMENASQVSDIYNIVKSRIKDK